MSTITAPAGSDLYLLRWVLHNRDDERALAILRACRRAMLPSARLRIAEAVMPAANAEHAGTLLDLPTLVVTGGRERTAAEFELTRVIPAHPLADPIEARPS